MKQLYGQGRWVPSFEVFPPKSDAGLEGVYQTVQELTQHQPGFISITYGAGGSTRGQSLEMAAEITGRFQLPVTAHFTCVGTTVAEIRAWLSQATEVGVDAIMALRGDPPAGQTQFQAVDGGLRYANELVSLIRTEFPHFGIGVAAYPEVHQEAVSAETDLAHLVHKVACGADAVFTQLFYDNDDFFRFRDRCVAAGISVPIVPGLLPVLSLKQIQRITTLCKAKLPATLVAQLESAGDDAMAQVDVGVEHATRQTEGLIAGGVPGIHYYVLNRSDSIRRILADFSQPMLA